MRKIWIIGIFCSCLPFWMLAQGTVSFVATSDAKQVVLGGYFEVMFTLANANGANFKAPRFDGFNVLSGPSQSLSTTSINGRWSRKTSYSYTLQPKRVGKYPIPPASIQVNGKTLKTDIIYVEIVKGKDNSATTQEELLQQLEEQIFIKAVPSTTEAHVGEQILLDYKLYTTQGVESYNLVEESDYPGFYAQDIRQFDGRVIKEVINGIQYSTKVLKRVALFPQQAGLLAIAPLTMELAITASNRQARRPRSFFYTPLLTQINVTADSLAIKVLSPPPNAPPTFSGAVGKYQMTSSINRTKLSTDDAIAIKMNFKGDGDIKQVQAPRLMVSDSFELYDPKVLEEKSVEANGALVSTKSIEYLLLPRFPGRYQLQPRFTYFDTDSLAYLTLASNPFQLEISQGKNKGTRVLPLEDLAVDDGEIRDILPPGTLKMGQDEFLGSSLFWSLCAFPFLLLGGVILVKRVQLARGPIDPEVLRRQQAQKVATQRLAQAKVFLDQQNSRAFYDEISKGLLGYVGDKLNLPLSEMGQDNIRQRLSALEVSEAPVERFMGVLKTCEMALFAGKDNAAAMQESYQTALAVVTEVEQELRGKK